MNQEYLVGNIKNLNYKYNLYYSNNFINGTSINIIKKSKNWPKFITEDDFILDIDEIQKYFSKLKLTEIKNNNIKRRVNLLEVNNDDGELYNNIIFITNKTIIIDQIINADKDTIKEINRLNEYINRITEKLNDIENNDIYFESIGEHLYTKNYIGFKSNENLDKFNEIEFDLFKTIFPNGKSSAFAIVSLILFTKIIILYIINLIIIIKHEDQCLNLLGVLISWISFFSIALGFLIYFCVIYTKVYKNNSLKILKSIESDEHINKFLQDITSKFENTIFIKCSIGLFTTSIALYIIGLILLISLNK